MKKVIGEWSTIVKMTHQEATVVCGLGEGPGCCAFLASGPEGFICIRMDYPTNSTIFKRLEEGTMNAKGKGGWIGCAWEGDIVTEENQIDPEDEE